MNTKYKTLPITLDLDKILHEYANEKFKLNPGFSLISVEFFVDINKNKVCFLLGTAEKIDESV